MRYGCPVTDSGGYTANWWTLHIGQDGKILAVDKTVKPDTSVQDIAAKLEELGVRAM